MNKTSIIIKVDETDWYSKVMINYNNGWAVVDELIVFDENNGHILTFDTYMLKQKDFYLELEHSKPIIKKRSIDFNTEIFLYNKKDYPDNKTILYISDELMKLKLISIEENKLLYTHNLEIYHSKILNRTQQQKHKIYKQVREAGESYSTNIIKEMIPNVLVDLNYLEELEAQKKLTNKLIKEHQAEITYIYNTLAGFREKEIINNLAYIESDLISLNFKDRVLKFHDDDNNFFEYRTLTKEITG